MTQGGAGPCQEDQPHNQTAGPLSQAVSTCLPGRGAELGIEFSHGASDPATELMRWNPNKNSGPHDKVSLSG